MPTDHKKDEYQVAVRDMGNHTILAEDLEQMDMIPTGSGAYHIIHHGQSFKIAVLESDFLRKAYRIKVNNMEFDLSIANPLDIKIAEMGFDTAKNTLVNHIAAPMPGLILDINIEAGQAVKENDPLLVLEAMKMENVLTAPRDGVIKTICCSRGEAVEKTQLLVEFES